MAHRHVESVILLLSFADVRITPYFVSCFGVVVESGKFLLHPLPKPTPFSADQQ